MLTLALIVLCACACVRADLMKLKPHPAKHHAGGTDTHRHTSMRTPDLYCWSYFPNPNAN